MTETAESVTCMVRQRFAKVATDPQAEKIFPVGLESARSLGYDVTELEGLPPSVSESFCGVGNPFELGYPQEGEIVLDLGSGAGLDSLLAARKVGARGRVIGLDVTEEMLDKARHNAEVMCISNVEFLKADVSNIPMADSSVDMAISNGVLNLCFDKKQVLTETFRVLRSGGRFQMADILLYEEVTPDEVKTKGEWSD